MAPSRKRKAAAAAAASHGVKFTNAEHDLLAKLMTETLPAQKWVYLAKRWKEELTKVGDADERALLHERTADQLKARGLENERKQLNSEGGQSGGRPQKRRKTGAGLSAALQSPQADDDAEC
jgi:hypothetical protein